MSWLLLGLAIPVFVAFLTRSATRSDTVSSLAIYEVLAAEIEPRRRFAVPHHLVALLLTLLALIAGTLALAGVGSDERDIVVVLDRSASMGAEDGRWEDALHALDDIADLGAGERIALVSGGLVEPYTEDGSRLQERARTWLPEGADAGSRDLRIASRLDADEIVWITDGVHAVELPADVRVLQVGGPITNLGLSDVALRVVDGLGAMELQLGVVNASDTPLGVDVALEVDGVPVEVVGLDVPANGSAQRVVRGQWSGQQLELHLSGEDGLVADDRVVVPLEQPERIEVALLSDAPRSFLAEALAVHPRVDLVRCGADVRCDGHDLVFVEGALPLPDAEQIVVFDGTGATVEDPAVLRWAFDDPAFRFVDFSRLGTTEAALVGGEPLIEVDEGAIAAREGHVLRFGFDLVESDLPVRMAFLNLVANLVDDADSHTPLHATGLLDGGESSMAAQPLSVVGRAPSPGGNPSRWLLLAALLLLGFETALPALRRLRQRREERRLGTRRRDEARLAG